jgi:hypothetical protein
VEDVKPVEAGAEFEEIEREPQLSNSLGDRMKARASELEKQQADFPIPGYDDVLEVELRALGYQTIRRVQRKNEKIRDPTVQELYTLADQLLTATQGFREVFPDDREPQEIDDTWVTLAKRLPNCPEDVTPRQAILKVIGDKRLAFLVQDWSEWARTVRSDVDEEVVADFGATG